MRCESLDDSRFMELYELALHTPADRRRHRLLEACDGDEQLAGDVVARAEGHDQMGEFLLHSPIAALAAEIRFATGEVVAGRFHVIREVGEGGMGIVYEVFDRKVGRRCALKCPKPGFARQLPAETSAALSITHDNVCRVYGIYTADTPHGAVDVLVMEYLDGETLTEVVRRSGPLDHRTAREIALQICAGLQTAHRAGVLHCDLKSTNIMLTSGRDGQRRAVITDFGLAGCLTEDGVTASVVMGGTPPFMAPELLAGAPASQASDLFALGVVLYEMVSGRLPDRINPLPPSRVAPRLPRRWDRVTSACLADAPARRPKNVAAAAAIVRGRSRAAVWAARIAAAVAITAGGYAAMPDPPPVRLAVLPLQAGADQELTAMSGGLMHDVSRRLARVESVNDSFLVISLGEATRFKVADGERARTRLGATHALLGEMRRADRGFALHAAVVDLQTRVTLRELSANYDTDRITDVPAALTGTVTGALELSAGPRDIAMSAVGYFEFARGMFHLRAGLDHADAAIAHLQRAVREEPRSALPPAALAEAFLNKFQITRDAEWLKRAEANVATAESRQPDDVHVRLASGRLNRATARHDQSIADFRRVLQLEPQNVQAWLGLASTYQEMGTRTADAAASYQQAVDLQPHYYLPHFEFGTFYFARGHYRQAERHFLQVIAAAPDNALAHSNLGAVYADLGRFADAERTLRRSLALEFARSPLINLGAVFNYQGRDREALAVYQKALTSGHPTFVLLVNVGDTYRRLGDEAEAAAAYRQGLQLADREVLTNPTSGYARAFVAYFMARLGQHDLARRELEQALRLAPADGKVMRRAVLTYETLGERDRALGAVRQAPPNVVDELGRQPDLKALGNDPRFQELLRSARAKLAEES